MNNQVDALSSGKIGSVDPIWDTIRKEAEDAANNDPVLGAFLYTTILNQPSLEAAVIHRVCERLDHPDLNANLLRQVGLARFLLLFPAAAPSAPEQSPCHPIRWRGRGEGRGPREQRRSPGWCYERRRAAGASGR